MKIDRKTLKKVKEIKVNHSEDELDKGKVKEFDLNIEKILENWENYHAIREIIANALDEQVLTNTLLRICSS